MEKGKIIKNGNVKLELLKFEGLVDESATLEYDRMSTVISEHVSKIVAEKERIVRERLTLIAGEIDLVKESQRTFPRIARKVNTGHTEEHWYWNDGSEDGLRIVSFYFDEPKFDGEFSMKAGLSYR